ncbi:MAG: leucine-rich repeat protein, partial [Kiritimatiellae bacterium]|nr:leucine-rich repeat protein [Kiritimatiellia bacterium]
MKTKLTAMVLAAGAALGAAADEVVRWYDSAQKVTWGYILSNGEATISTPGFWDSNARDVCRGDITVPAQIGPDGPDGAVTYPVRDMAPGLFRNCTKVTSVTLPDGIVRIAPNAFYFDSGSTLTNVTVGAGCLDIGENAFCRCHSLVQVNIPNTVTNIAKDAFTMCRALPRVDIPGSVRVIGDSAFSACSALETATIGDGVEVLEADAFMNCSSLLAADLPASVRSIGDRAFYGCNQLASATLREGLEKIGFCAFNQCESLASVSIPESVTWVGERAFQFCPDSIFDKTTVPGVCLLSGWAVGVDNPFGAIDLLSVNGVADGLFTDCRDVTSVVLPPGIETLGGSMFSGCRTLESVSLPAVLKSIESYAFQSCQKIQAVNIPSGVTNIGQLAFGYCEKLAAVSLPADLAAMGDNAFDGCTNLTSLTIPASLKRIPMGAFENCTSLTDVTVEEGVEVIGNASFYRCTGLSSFTIPDSVKVVEDIAFGGCRFVNTTAIANVEMVDGWVVDANTETLTEVVVPGDVRGIADNAFENCRKLTNAVLEAGVARVPDYAFNCATKLADVSLPDTVTEIGAFAFCDCDSLVEAWVPSNIVSVGERAFASCAALETVYLPVALMGAVDEAKLLDGSFLATVRYYNPDGSLVPPPVPGPGPEPEAEMRTVSFNPNGGGFDDEGEAVRDVEKGAAVGELPVPSRLGYSFGGWWTAKTKGTKVTAKTKVTKNVTYYARWTVRKYKVAASVSAKAAGSASGAGLKAYGSKVTLKATPKKGYVFVRWVNLADEETPWPSAVKCRQPSASFTMGAEPVSVRAVFAKTTADAAPLLFVDPAEIWYVEDDPDREIFVEADSLSYPAVTLSGAPSGIGIVRVAGTDCGYILKVTDASKLKPGVYTAKITAKNRAGKSVSKSVRIVAPNTSAAIANGLIAGLETSTLSPYVAPGGMKTKWTLADIGVEVFATNGWKLVSVTGLPTGLSWNGSAIVGAASKVGIYAVTFKMQKKVGSGKKAKTYTSIATATFTVEALLPTELAGTYNGFANTNVLMPDEGDEGENGDGEGEGEDEETYGYYTPIVDGWASSVKVTVTTAGKITAKIGGVTLSGAGFDSESNGVYAVTLKKTQKITKGALKGGTNVWVAELMIDTTAGWDACQITGDYCTYNTKMPSMTAPVWIAAQRNPFALAEAK